MSAPTLAPEPTAFSNLVLSVDPRPTAPRITVTGRVASSGDADHLRDAVREACREAPARIVVDLNLVEGLNASIIEAIVGIRREVAGTVIAIDISRLHGPLLLALLAQVIDPGGP